MNLGCHQSSLIIWLTEPLSRSKPLRFPSTRRALAAQAIEGLSSPTRRWASEKLDSGFQVRAMRRRVALLPQIGRRTQHRPARASFTVNILDVAPCFHIAKRFEAA